MALLEKFWFGCIHCHGQENCPLTGVEGPTSGDGREPYRGKGLAVSAGVVFLLPIIFVILGAYVSGELWAQSSLTSLGRWQTVGALAGLVAGVLFAKLILTLLGSRRFGEGGMSNDD